MAEIAGALGARLVIFGQLGSLEDELILTLNLYDADEGESVGRAARRSTSLKELSAMINPMVTELVADKVKPSRSPVAIRLLVMDLENVAGPVVPTKEPVEAERELPVLMISGLGALGVAALAGITAVVAGANAAGSQAALEDKASTLQRDAPGLIEARDGAALFTNIMWGVAASAAIVGGGLVVVGGVE